MLRDESLSTFEDMEIDTRTKEEKFFVKILKDKNNKKVNKHSSQPLNNKQLSKAQTHNQSDTNQT